MAGPASSRERLHWAGQDIWDEVLQTIGDTQFADHSDQGGDLHRRPGLQPLERRPADSGLPGQPGLGEVAGEPETFNPCPDLSENGLVGLL